VRARAVGEKMAWQAYLVFETLVALVCLRVVVCLVGELNVRRDEAGDRRDAPRERRFQVHPVVENLVTAVLAGFGVETWMLLGRYVTAVETDDGSHVHPSLLLFCGMTLLLAVVAWLSYVWYRSSVKSASCADANRSSEAEVDPALRIPATALACAFLIYAIGPLHRALD